MPGTWSSWGVDGDGDGKKDPFDPDDAIPAAASYDCHLKGQVRGIGGDPTSLMLAAYNAGPGAVQKYKGIPPYTETRNYVEKITSRASELATEADGQNSVGPDGCPTSAPSNTMRSGSSSIGIARLCADSVRAAATPQAARAVKYALNHLGLPYSQERRMQSGWYDCSSLVMRSYDSAGVDVLVGGWGPDHLHHRRREVGVASLAVLGQARRPDPAVPWPRDNEARRRVHGAHQPDRRRQSRHQGVLIGVRDRPRPPRARLTSVGRLHGPPRPPWLRGQHVDGTVEPVTIQQVPAAARPTLTHARRVRAPSASWRRSPGCSLPGSA